MMNAEDSIGRAGQREIAREAGVSVMTVSRALNLTGPVAAATRERILEVAARLGYRPDPKLAELMGRLRQARAKPFTGVMAWVWPDGTEAAVRSSALLGQLIGGAKRRAAEFGYRLDEFFLEGTEWTPARLDRTLYARGIGGVIIGPVSFHAHRHLSLRWERYHVVTVGLGLWKPEFHRAHHDHFRGMLDLLRLLRHRGRKRIALLVSGETDRRMFGAWRAAFLAHAPVPPGSAPADFVRLRDLKKAEAPALKKWFRSLKADALIVDVADCAEVRKSLGLEERILIATLNWREPSRGYPGIDQQYGHLGAQAVDISMAAAHRGERGLPESPLTILCRGRVVE